MQDIFKVVSKGFDRVFASRANARDRIFEIKIFKK